MSWYMHITLGQVDAPPVPPPSPTAPTDGRPTTVAPAPTGEPHPDHPQQGSPWNLLTMMVLFLAIFWVLILLPQRREKKRRAALLGALKKGDKVQTVGGVLGTVVEVREEEVIVKVDEASNTRMRFTRGAIQSIESEDKGAGRG